MKNYLTEVIKRKDLLIYLVISGIKAEYRNTYFGYLWWVLDPLLMGIVYYLLRVVILGMQGENIGAFLIIGLITWKWIASAITSSAKSISSKAGIITQIYLPKAIFPLGTTLTQLINFSFGLIVIATFLALYRIAPGIYLLWLPIIMFVQFLFLAAMSLVIAYYATFIRDIENVLSHLMRFWFYGSPVIWESNRLPERFSYLIAVNPASVFLIGYRNILMYDKSPDLIKLFIVAVTSMAIIIYMLYYYHKNEHKLIKAL